MPARAGMTNPFTVWSVSKDRNIDSTMSGASLGLGESFCMRRPKVQAPVRGSSAGPARFVRTRLSTTLTSRTNSSRLDSTWHPGRGAIT